MENPEVFLHICGGNAIMRKAICADIPKDQTRKGMVITI